MSFGKLEQSDDSYLTSEQINMLMAIDPKFKDKYEQQRNVMDANDLNALTGDSFDRRMPDNGSYSRMLDTDGLPNEEPSGSGVYGGGAEGGFLQALLPFAPLIGQLAAPLIDGITSLFRRRGSGMTSPPNGGAIVEFFTENADALKKIEQDIYKMKPKQAWNTLHSLAKDIARKLLESHPSMAKHGSGFVGQLSDKMVDRMFPKGFLKIVNSAKSTEGSGVESALTPAGLAEPIIRYALSKMVGSGEIQDKVYQQVKQKMRSGAGYCGNGFNFRKIFDFAKRSLKIALPIIKTLTGKAIDSGVAKDAISGVLGKFKVFQNNPNLANTVSNLAQQGLKGATNMGFDKLSGEGADFEYEAEGEGMLKAPQSSGMLRPPQIVGGPRTVNPKYRQGSGKKKSSVGKFKIILS